MTIMTCLGDSITDCGHCFSSDSLGSGYVKMLADRFRQEGLQVQMRNCGTDGFTVLRLLQKIKEDKNITSNIITVLIGINDIGMMMNTNRTPFQQNEMMDSFQKHYSDLLTILTKQSSKVILIEPFVFDCPAFYQNWKPLLKKMCRIIQQLAQHYQLPLISLQGQLDEMVRRYGYSAITTDGIHLTSQGQQFLSQCLYSCITEHNYV